MEDNEYWGLEHWVKIPFVENREISSLGNVRYKNKKNIWVNPMPHYFNKKPYLYISIKPDDENALKFVHEIKGQGGGPSYIDGEICFHAEIARIVAYMFLPEYSREKRLYHIDGNLDNNAVLNLTHIPQIRKKVVYVDDLYRVIRDGDELHIQAVSSPFQLREQIYTLQPKSTPEQPEMAQNEIYKI